MSTEEYGAIVIGGGPGGYVAAIRLGQLGVKTLLIEKDALGGECLNRGCIPSKVLITGVNAYWSAKKADWIKSDGLSLDWGKLQAKREKVLRRLRLGVKYLLQENGVKVLEGRAVIKADKTVKVELRDGIEKAFKAENIVIATGGEHVSIASIPLDGRKVVTSSQALELKEVPKRMLVVGGGVSGLEIGTLYAKLGTEVTIVELMDQLLPGIEKDLVQVVQKKMRKLGIKIYTGSKVVASKVNEEKVKAQVEKKDESTFEIEADYAMVAVGKRANAEEVGAVDAGIELTPRGFIKVNDRMETNIEGIYAIGDVTGPPFLAHRASYHAIIAAENIAGVDSIANEVGMPSAIFTDPEIALAGLTEQTALEKGITPKVGKFVFSALGRAVLENETDGFVKVIADASTGEVIGCQMVGAHVSELIAEAVLAIRNKLTIEQFARSIRPHPTFSEALTEAAEAALWKPIHMLVK